MPPLEAGIALTEIAESAREGLLALAVAGDAGVDEGACGPPMVVGTVCPLPARVRAVGLPRDFLPTGW